MSCKVQSFPMAPLASLVRYLETDVNGAELKRCMTLPHPGSRFIAASFIGSQQTTWLSLAAS